MKDVLNIPDICICDNIYELEIILAANSCWRVYKLGKA